MLPKTIDDLVRKQVPCGLCDGLARGQDSLCHQCREIFDGDPPDHVLKPSALNSMKIPFRFATADPESARGLLASWSPPAGGGLFLTGPVGAGKTYAACALLKAQAITTRKLGLFVNVAQLLDDLRASFDGQPDPLPTIITSNPLVLDDLCVERVTEWARERFYLLVNGRYNAGRAAIYTSNSGLDDVARLYGERVASRIAENCQVVKLEGPDRRTPTRQVGQRVR